MVDVQGLNGPLVDWFDANSVVTQTSSWDRSCPKKKKGNFGIPWILWVFAEIDMRGEKVDGGWLTFLDFTLRQT